jgi:hypothetical protein
MSVIGRPGKIRRLVTVLPASRPFQNGFFFSLKHPLALVYP